MKTRIIGIVVAVVLAVFGLVVLMGYVGGADNRALAQVRLTTVYVVKKDIPAGTPSNRLGQYISTQSIPAVGAVPERVTDLSQISGMVATTQLEVGEQLIKPRWAVVAKAVAGDEGLAIPKGYEALTIAVPHERELGGVIQTGDRVGVIIAAKDDEDQNLQKSRQALQKILVLAVQDPSKNTKSAAPAVGSGTGQSNQVLVTLAVTRPGAEIVAWGQEFGAVYLALQPATAGEGSRSVNGKVVFP